jgi:hypothetical protein
MTLAAISSPAAGRLEGEARKDAALELLIDRREFYIRRMARALVETLLDRGQATIDDARRAVELPDGIDPRCCGAVTGPLARAGIMRRISYCSSARPEAHARPIGLWGLSDRDAALDWLDQHPDFPDPSDAEPEQRTLWD